MRKLTAEYLLGRLDQMDLQVSQGKFENLTDEIASMRQAVQHATVYQGDQLSDGSWVVALIERGDVYHDPETAAAISDEDMDYIAGQMTQVDSFMDGYWEAVEALKAELEAEVE